MARKGELGKRVKRVGDEPGKISSGSQALEDLEEKDGRMSTDWEGDI